MNWTKWIWPGVVVVALLWALVVWFETGRVGQAASEADSVATEESAGD